MIEVSDKRIAAGARALCRHWDDDIEWSDALDQARVVIEAADAATLAADEAKLPAEGA